jgi:hypothetical protein
MSQALRDPKNAGRWHRTLCQMKRNIEVQFTYKAAEKSQKQAECLRQGPAGLVKYKQFEADMEKWKSGAQRFLNGLEDKIAESKEIIKTTDRDVYITIITEERNQIMGEVVKLRTAIQKHKEQVTSAEEPDEAIDEELWALAE